MLLDPADRGPEHRLSHATSEVVGSTQASLDLVESTDRRGARQDIDESGSNPQLKVHRRQNQGLG